MTHPVTALGVRARDYGFRHSGRKDPAISHINLDIAPGERVLLVGPSGAGKSTLLAALGGVLGSSAEDGEHTGTLQAGSPGEVGMVLQDPEAQTIYTRVGDDVAFGCENRGIPADEIWPRVRHGLDVVGLEVPLWHNTAELSGGQKQRLALAGVIAMGAGLILLDEPTANLDPEGAVEVVKAVVDAVNDSGATLVVVEHRLELWVEHVDRMIVLGHGGRIVADGPPQEILDSHGEQLATQGVWVPEQRPSMLEATTAASSATQADNVRDAAVWTEQLQCGWDAQTPTASPRTVSIPLGQTTAITGANGVGKTTFALTIAGLLQPLSGTMGVHESIAQGLAGRPHDWSSTQLAKRISYVFQDPEAQFVASTVRDELLITAAAVSDSVPARGSLRRKRTADVPQHLHERADELLERLGLSHLAQANPFSLSGGQKRRLSVATALVASPSLVLLDEPTFGQDRNTFFELLELIKQLNGAGVTVAAITHDPTFVSHVADHHIELGA
ncbi:ABC transporter ATP-binding protein [Corynebacterium aquilae]|uniref:ABC transporter domain-containing protein n=1 Tax=Corynebacterium aquilae DSM 44791 TaxID=1431546 RepID=A0A1L7CFA5_9CORY|nr:ATP-binding cassette domain-containing protein [Corynebacterium aquilae]APT84463.1 hypothetical protein CAQU_04630 [Corynebacterium aquilae DSM 44791]